MKRGLNPVLIASDHAGFALKKHLINHASELDCEFVDLGTDNKNSVDYPDYAKILCEKLLAKGAPDQNVNQFGILICGSGVGVSIAANRYSHIRAVLAESAEVAKLAREHNHANVLCLGARIVSEDQAKNIIKSFLNAHEDQGERHVKRVRKLSEIKSG